MGLAVGALDPLTASASAEMKMACQEIVLGLRLLIGFVKPASTGTHPKP
jgi:hypothetical protein